LFFYYDSQAMRTPAAATAGKDGEKVSSSAIVTTSRDSVKIAVWAPSGKRASPYRVEGRALVKRVSEPHIFKAKQAVGIDEAVWQRCREHIDIVRFVWWDGRVFEMPAKEFESKTFLHGDGVAFALTRFVPIKELRLVRERPPVRGQLALFAGVGS
jgi:hypothetical protein